MHRSVRRGAGVEFGGQRPYVPGDDLRFLDRRSLMRHDRLMVREFESQGPIRHEFIKRLHKRFDEEEIDIPFPIRTVMMKGGAQSP